MVIQGPPGTGKSSVISLTIKQIYSKTSSGRSPPKIMVCAPSNASVDNLAVQMIKATAGELFGGELFSLKSFLNAPT